MRLGGVLTDADFVQWLTAAKSSIDFYYWNRYRKLLAHNHLSQRVIDTIHLDTDRTLEFLQNPQLEGTWKRRGMVMGHVQSGKTANYLGLIAKAADAGYKIIVVIAGIHDNLRNQTQRRIDEGFVGRDSARDRSRNEDTRIGVGLFDNTRRPCPFTSSLRDFNKAAARAVGVPLQNLREPAIFVIKKNPSTLRSLIEWIRELNTSASGSTLVDSPLLLIDDEADNASINVAREGSVSTINGQIRQLLQLFSRSCYVGYTATPFANIFIDPESKTEMLAEDLFPRHFIVSLDPPSNYVGATRVFLDEPDKFIRYIEDSDELLPVTHKQTHIVDELPDSLVTAIRAFIIARALRLLRGHRTAHCSMLVNVSRFTLVQSQVKAEVQRVLAPIQESARLHAGLSEKRALADPEMAALRTVFLAEFADRGFEWIDVQKTLIDASAPIKVMEVNNKSPDALNYQGFAGTGLSVIAVGGYSLSRGLTLDGLMVSYYLRNSQMYDTLMQMARWFGYRDDYDDLCRVWMPAGAVSWYVHIAESIELLREELRQMAAAGATPAEFGLKVRAHPDSLRITAMNKMGSSERMVFSIGLSGKLIETSTVHAVRSFRDTNVAAARTLVASLESGGFLERLVGGPGSSRVYSRVPADVIATFIRAYRNHPSSLLTDPGPVASYIDQRSNAELASWDVALVGVQVASEDPDVSLGVPINRQFRNSGESSNPRALALSDNRRVATVGAERFGLTAEEIAIAESQFRKSMERDGRAVKAVPDSAYRKVRTRPLMLLHVLRVKGSEEVSEPEPVIAYSLSFPKTSIEEQHVEYVVTSQWRREHAISEAVDELTPEDVGL